MIRDSRANQEALEEGRRVPACGEVARCPQTDVVAVFLRRRNILMVGRRPEFSDLPGII
jgi:hypothetical protein